jgi:peroxiredoxin Q/BCP
MNFSFEVKTSLSCFFRRGCISKGSNGSILCFNEAMKRILLFVGVFMLGFGKVQAETLKVGDPAPNFTAPASDGSQVELKSVLNSAPIVLYFYPKDDTPGCTKEACSFRDNFAAFRKLDATIFGISYDTVESHKEFITKYKLPFILLSDKDHAIAKLYGADGLLFAKRMTFVVDQSGKIAWINPKVDPTTHSQELEAVLAKLNSQKP